MIFNFALLSNLLLASASLAVSSSGLVGDRLARRDEIYQSQPISTDGSSADGIPVETSNYWAGAVLPGSNETFTLAVGTFKVPKITGKDGSGAVWVGIDGNAKCTQAILQTGIKFDITQNKNHYKAWYRWYPKTREYFYDIDIRPGDVITATVAADNTTFGMAVIENLTTKQTVYQYLSGNSSTALCEASAEWIVEDLPLSSNGAPAPFVNFSNVTFNDAYAFDSHGTKYNPSNSDVFIIEIEHGKKISTSVAIHGGNVTINYIG